MAVATMRVRDYMTAPAVTVTPETEIMRRFPAVR
jgi:hypothetical protein